MQTGASAAGGSAGHTGASADPELAALGRQLAARRREAEADRDRRRPPERPVAAVATSAAALVAIAERVASPAERTRRVDQLVGEMRKRVACDNLFRGRCVYIAWAIVDGRVPQGERLLYEVLANLDRVRRAGDLREPASKYFNTAWSRILSDHGVASQKPRVEGGPENVRKPK